VLSHLAVIDNDENRSEVEFVARYKVNGRAFRLHERSVLSEKRGDGGMLMVISPRAND